MNNLLTIEEFEQQLNESFKEFNGPKSLMENMKKLKKDLLKAYQNQQIFDLLIKKNKWLHSTLQGQFGYLQVGAITNEDKLAYLVNCKNKDYQQQNELIKVSDCNNQAILTLVGKLAYEELYREQKLMYKK